MIPIILISIERAPHTDQQFLARCSCGFEGDSGTRSLAVMQASNHLVEAHREQEGFRDR